MFIKRCTSCWEETQALGKRLGNQLRSGDIILLSGELGAGKTVLAKGIAEGWGIHDVILSPTFTLLKEYRNGHLALYHFDWYRVQSEEEIYALGFDEIIGTDGITLIEWPEHANSAIPPSCLEIIITRKGYDNERSIQIQAFGSMMMPKDV